MDVLKLARHSSSGTTESPSITNLNTAKFSPGAALKAGRWGDAMNHAVADRAAKVAVGVNGAKSTDAQKSLHNGDLNFRMKILEMAAGAGKGDSSTATDPDALDARFNGLGARAVKAKDGPLSARDAKLQQTSQTLVNQFFMGSMLKQMRDSPFKNETFSGGKAGQAYAGLFDQHVAEHSGNRIAKSLVHAMMKAYSRRTDDSLPANVAARQAARAAAHGVHATSNVKRLDSVNDPIKRASNDAVTRVTA